MSNVAPKLDTAIPGGLFNLDGMTLTEIEEFSDACILHAVADSSPPSVCPKCGNPARWWKHTASRVSIMHTPMNGKPCEINVTKPRWSCTHCKAIYSAPNPKCVEEGTTYTQTLYQKLTELCMERKLLDIQKDYGISDSSLQRFSDALIERFDDAYKFPLPYKLGLDEVNISGTFRTTVTNLERRTLIDLLPERRGKYLLDHFSEHYTEEERQGVYWVCTDMYRPFEKTLHRLFPNAKWVIDKWHVLKEANLALEVLRKNVQSQFKEPKTRLGIKKTLRWYLLRRYDNLSEEDKLFLIPIQTILPELYQAYRLKESFYDIYDHGVRDDAEQAFDDWKRSIPSDDFFAPFRKVASTVENFRQPIFNHWDSGALTNAFTECSNSLIRATDRLGRGYKFSTLRGRILYNRHALDMARFNGVSYGASLTDLAEQSESKSKVIQTVDMRINEQDLENSTYKEFLTETKAPIRVDTEKGEILQ